MNRVLQRKIIMMYDVRCFVNWMSNKPHKALENLPQLFEYHECTQYGYTCTYVCMYLHKVLACVSKIVRRSPKVRVRNKLCKTSIKVVKTKQQHR
jgi:hypothetical protein